MIWKKERSIKCQVAVSEQTTAKNICNFYSIIPTLRGINENLCNLFSFRTAPLCIYRDSNVAAVGKRLLCQKFRQPGSADGQSQEWEARAAGSRAAAGSQSHEVSLAPRRNQGPGAAGLLTLAGLHHPPQGHRLGQVSPVQTTFGKAICCI